MVAIKKILDSLPDYKNSYVKISSNQSVNDIISAIKVKHKESSADYDKIYKFFIGSDEIETLENIFNFLRKYTIYKIENEDEQKVLSPSAILREKKIDCKNYALFVGGILDAINRSGLYNIPYSYRFISDNIISTVPNHVFIVAYPNTGEEIFIDPIPQVKYFNDKINYYYSVDKKINGMALYSVNGIGNSVVNTFKNFKLPETKKNKSNNSGLLNFKVPVIGISPNDVIAVVNIAKNLFGGNPPNRYWVTWDKQDIKAGHNAGSALRGWTINDGDSVRNEAENILAYIGENGFKNFFQSPTLQIKNGSEKWAGNGWRIPTVNEFLSKLERGGFSQEAAEMKRVFNNSSRTSSGTGSNNNSGNNRIVEIDEITGQPKRAGMNAVVTLGLVGAGLYLISNMKK